MSKRDPLNFQLNKLKDDDFLGLWWTPEKPWERMV